MHGRKGICIKRSKEAFSAMVATILYTQKLMMIKYSSYAFAKAQVQPHYKQLILNSEQ